MSHLISYKPEIIKVLVNCVNLLNSVFSAIAVVLEKVLSDLLKLLLAFLICLLAYRVGVETLNSALSIVV